MDEIDEIPHNQYLTWVDTFKAQFHPLVSRNPATGQISYPRRDYLTEVANFRKEQAEAKGQKIPPKAKTEDEDKNPENTIDQVP